MNTTKSMRIRLLHKYYSGFTLVEILMVVVIVGLLLAVLVPGVSHARETSQNARLANDWRAFTATFQSFTLENGNYPADAAAAVIPIGMDEHLKEFEWTEETFVGGNWDWDYNSFGIRAGVSLVGSNINLPQMQDFDDKFDDGDLASGFFQKIGATRYALILEH